MKDRTIPCKFYDCEYECQLGHEGTFYHSCQKCRDYVPQKNRQPARKDLRQEKKHKRESNNWRDWGYED